MAGSMSSAFVLWNEFLQKIKTRFIKLDLQRIADIPNIYYISLLYMYPRFGCYCTCYHVYRLYYFHR